MSAGFDVSTPAVVVEASHQGALAAIRSLGRLGVPVIGVNERAGAPVARSRYLRDVVVTEPSVDAWLGAVNEHAVLIATDDRSTLFAQEHAEELRERFAFPVVDAALVHALYNKLELHVLCERHDIATPRTFAPRSRTDVEEWLAGEARPPVVVKPLEPGTVGGSAGRWVAIARTVDEALAAFSRLEHLEQPQVLVQEFVGDPDGEEDSVWIFNGYFDASSRCLAALTGQKLRQRPPRSGTTTLGVVRPNDEVSEQSVRLLEALGYRGLVDIDWCRDPRDGRYKLIDVNPRLGATFRLFADGDGMDLLRLAYLDLTGQALPALSPPIGRRWLCEDDDVATAIATIRIGQLGPVEWMRSLRGVEELVWFARDDLAPFAAAAAPRAKAAAKRTAVRAYRAGRAVRMRVVPPPPWEGVRILCYHRVADDTADPLLAVAPDRFREQLEEVLASGARPVRLGEALADGGRSFCVTFDDAYRDNLEHAEPILRDLGVPATIYVPTGIVEGDATYFWYEDRAPPALAWDEIGELARGGLVDFGSHTRTHPWLPRLPDRRAREEIAGSKDDLERALGRPVASFAYPAGLYVERDVQFVRDAGYVLAVTTDPGVNGSGADRLLLRRTLVYGSDSRDAFTAKLAGNFDRETLARRLVVRRNRRGDESSAYASLRR